MIWTESERIFATSATFFCDKIMKKQEKLPKQYEKFKFNN